MEETNPLVDWCNLPAGVTAESLWDTLHDGNLLSVRSDLLARTVTLLVDVPHVRDHHEFPEDDRFLIQLQEVQSARTTTSLIWPGPLPDTKGLSRTEEHSLILEYQAKGREVSTGWDDFEALFADNSFEISTADIARSRDGVSLKLGVMMDETEGLSQYFVILIRASQLTIQHTDGRSIDLESFVKLGEDYWKAWASERPDSGTGSVQEDEAS